MAIFMPVPARTLQKKKKSLVVDFLMAVVRLLSKIRPVITTNILFIQAMYQVFHNGSCLKYNASSTGLALVF